MGGGGVSGVKIGENKGKNVKEMGMVYFYCVEIHRELDWDMGVCVNSLRYYISILGKGCMNYPL